MPALHLCTVAKVEGAMLCWAARCDLDLLIIAVLAVAHRHFQRFHAEISDISVVSTPGHGHPLETYVAS